MVTTTSMAFSFLGAGPLISVEMPDEFDEIPEFSTPVLNGFGGRKLVFIPKQRVEPIGDDNVFLDRLSDRDGRPVDYFQRKELPPLWRLRWELSAGCMFTHLREEDPAEMAELTVKSISIIESGLLSLPFVAIYPPLTYGVSRIPDYEERAVFTSQVMGEGATIYFKRPADLAATDLLVPEESYAGIGVVRVGLGSDIEAEVALPSDSATCRDVATRIRRSFTVG